MKMQSLVAFTLVAALLPAHAQGAQTDALCAPVVAFLQSVQPEETRMIEYQTSWGRNFDDEPKPAVAAKRCQHHGAEQAKPVCKALIETGSVEFPGTVMTRLAKCILPPIITLNFSSESAQMSTIYETGGRGSRVKLELVKDAPGGGTLLKMTAEGY